MITRKHTSSCMRACQYSRCSKKMQGGGRFLQAFSGRASMRVREMPTCMSKHTHIYTYMHTTYKNGTSVCVCVCVCAWVCVYVCVCTSATASPRECGCACRTRPGACACSREEVDSVLFITWTLGPESLHVDIKSSFGFYVRSVAKVETLRDHPTLITVREPLGGRVPVLKNVTYLCLCVYIYL